MMEAGHVRAVNRFQQRSQTSRRPVVGRRRFRFLYGVGSVHGAAPNRARHLSTCWNRLIHWKTVPKTFFSSSSVNHCVDLCSLPALLCDDDAVHDDVTMMMKCADDI